VKRTQAVHCHWHVRLIESGNTHGVLINQRYEPSRILRAKRDIQTAGDFEPTIMVWFSFHIQKSSAKWSRLIS
jgi:hypothetical protein